MKTLSCVLGIVLGVLALSAFAQSQDRLSPDDQREFDKYYTKWVNDTRRNDRDDIAKDVGHMQEIMNRNHISADVSFDRIVSTGNAYAVNDYQGRLSTDEQREFDKYYTKWVNDTRKNDRDDIAKDVRRMQEIMARQNIPANVPFDQIARHAGDPRSESYPRGRGVADRLSATTSATSTGTMPSGSTTLARTIARAMPEMLDTCRQSWPGTISLPMYPSTRL